LKLEHVVPWGRSKDEYVRMFGLTDKDLSGRVLDCAGGPASFNAEATREGRRVVSCDPSTTSRPRTYPGVSGRPTAT
jgi:hypothetical protein